MQYMQTILASDIDHTLTGDDQALEQLSQHIRSLREADKLRLFLTTGRPYPEVLSGLEHENLPEPDAVIASVGTEIYLPPFTPDNEPLTEWDDRLSAHFFPEEAVTFASGLIGVEMQPNEHNSHVKISYYVDKSPHPEQAVSIIQQRIGELEVRGSYRIVWSSGRDLDILPASAGKRNGIRFLIKYLNLHPGQIITAGDSGNDKSMLMEFDHGIVVANAQPELKNLQEVAWGLPLYFAEKKYAAGVEEGLRHRGVIQDEEPVTESES